MTSLQRTPNKFSSVGDIPLSTESDNGDTYINTRKRKQPENHEYDQVMRLIEDKFDKQMSIWNAEISECIARSVAAAISSTIPVELKKVTSELTTINTNISQLTKNYDNMQKSFCDMEKSLNFASSRQDDFDTRMKKVEADLSQTNVSAAIHTLEEKLLSLEQQARQCNIEVSNIPDRRGENLMNILECMGKAINLPIRASDITTVHRVPHAHQNDRRPKNIIVKFCNRMMRDNVIAACRQTKGLDTTMLSIAGSPKKIYVNEHLTLQNKLLFRECREAARGRDYKYVWIKHGGILAHKTDTSPIIAIRSASDISKII